MTSSTRDTSSRPAVSAGGVAFRRQGGAIEVALISVGEAARWQLPKGTVGRTESFEAAARREVREETGLETELLELIETIEYWFYITTKKGGKVRLHKHVHFYLLRFLGGDVSQHDHEVNEARWFDIDTAIEKLAFENERRVVRQARDLIAALPDG